MLPQQLRVFNKHVTNRILRVFTNGSRGPFAIIGHVGRRSGKPYETVIWVFPTKAGFIIALTYGTRTDWLRNMQAAGGGTVFWHRKLYRVEKPELVDTATALTAFPAFFRLLFRTVGKRMQFVEMKSPGAEPVRG